jgi:hypothetical protein
MGACRWLRERAVVLTLIGIVVIVLAVSGLALCAMRSKVRLKVHASLLKLASFSIEVESQDGRQGSELPPSSDSGPRCRAGAHRLKP